MSLAVAIPSRRIRHQQGATLLVAIIMLLIITLLALSSMRGVSLESRITGNLKTQKTLFNAAEGGLRIGENSISRNKAPSLDSSCNAVSCLRWMLTDPGLAATAGKDTPSRFTTADTNNVTSVTTNYDVKVQWYVVDLGNLVGSSMGNCAASGCGPHHYEVNACASTVLCTSDTTTPRIILRTVIARYYQ
jgi:type IV pilus assembly protein PilX